MAVESHVLEALFRLGVDKQAIQRLKSETQPIEKLFQNLDRLLEEYRQKLHEGVGDTGATEQIIKILREQREELILLSDAGDSFADAQEGMAAASKAAAKDIILGSKQIAEARAAVQESLLAGEDPAEAITNLRQKEKAYEDFIAAQEENRLKTLQVAAATEEYQTALLAIVQLQEEAKRSVGGGKGGLIAIDAELAKETERAIEAIANLNALTSDDTRPDQSRWRQRVQQAKDNWGEITRVVGQATNAAYYFGAEISASAENLIQAAGLLDQIQYDPVTAGISAVALAFQVFRRETKRVRRAAKGVTEAWTERTQAIAASQTDAVSAAEQYTRAQDLINQKLEDSSIIAKTVISRRAVLNAKEEDVQRMLAAAAKDYEDYTKGVAFLNEELIDGELAVRKMSEAEFLRTQQLGKLLGASQLFFQAMEKGYLELEDIRRSQGGAAVGAVAAETSLSQIRQAGPEIERTELRRITEEAKALIFSTARSQEEALQAVRAYNAAIGESGYAINLRTVQEFQYLQKSAEGLEELGRVTQQWSPIVSGVTLTTRQAIDRVEELMETYKDQSNVVQALQVQHDKLVRSLKLEEEAAEIDLVKAQIETNRELEDAQREHLKEEERMAEEDAYQREELLADLNRELLKLERQKNKAQERINLMAVLEIEDIWKGLPAEIAAIEADISAQRLSAMVDFYEEASEMEEDYYKERAQAVADFSKEVQRSEMDHQKDMRRMREDSELRQRAAIRSRDALALAEEKRDYERDRGRAEEDYAIEAARRSEDFAQQLVQMEVAFREQAAERQEAYEEQVAELQKSLEEQKKEREDDYQEQADQREEQRVNDLRAEEDNYNEQKRQMEESHQEQLDSMDRSLDRQEYLLDRSLGDQEEQISRSFDRQRRELGFWTNDEEQEFSSMFNTILRDTKRWARDNEASYRSGLPGVKPIGTGKHTGGYLGSGTYRTGEQGYEYLLSHKTTKEAETLLGGQLTQQGLITALSGISGGNTNTFNIDISVSSGGGSTETADVVKIQVLKVLNRILPQVN